MALSLLPMAVAAFLRGSFREAAAIMTWAVVFTAVVTALPLEFMRYGVELSPAGIANGTVLLPWKDMVRIEVSDGWLSRRVWFVRDGRRTVLRGPWVLRTVFRTGYAEFDSGVAELRRWAEAHAPEAGWVYRRRGPDWLGDLVVMLTNCVSILVGVAVMDFLP